MEDSEGEGVFFEGERELVRDSYSTANPDFRLRQLVALATRVDKFF